MTEQVFINEIVKANFNLRQPKSRKPTNIYLVVRINQKQAKLSTGLKVYPEQWNLKKQEAFISCRLTESDNMNNIIANKKIIEIKNQFEDFKRYLCANPCELERGWELLKKYIYKDTDMKKDEKKNALLWLQKTIANDRKIKSSKDGKRGSTREVYQSILDDFKIFLKKNKNKDYIGFDDIDLGLIKDYETYLFNKKVNGDKTTATSTVANKCVQLIAMIKRAEPYNLIDIHKAQLDKYIKPKSRQGDENEIYLSEDEINNIYSLKLPYKEAVARDIFVLLCWTGQRYSDIESLNKGIVKKTTEGEILEIVQTKMTHRVSIPLFPIAKEILEKYKFNLPVYPSITILRYLKKIGLKAGLTEKHNVTEDRGSNIINTVKYRWELIGTHTARRSYINNMLKRHYDSHILMKITGHKSEDSFKKYVKLSSEDAALAILKTEADRTKDEVLPKVVHQEYEKSIDNQMPKVENIDDVLNYLFAYKELKLLREIFDAVGEIITKGTVEDKALAAKEAISDINSLENVKDLVVSIINQCNPNEVSEKVKEITHMVNLLSRKLNDDNLLATYIYKRKAIGLSLNNNTGLKGLLAILNE